jgi:hypothetical protein
MTCRALQPPRSASIPSAQSSRNSPDRPGATIAATLVQRRQRPDPSSLVGQGKLDEIVNVCGQHKCVACSLRPRPYPLAAPQHRIPVPNRDPTLPPTRENFLTNRIPHDFRSIEAWFADCKIGAVTHLHIGIDGQATLRSSAKYAAAIGRMASLKSYCGECNPAL